jgi:hypothetical protein
MVRDKKAQTTARIRAQVNAVKKVPDGPMQQPVLILVGQDPERGLRTDTKTGHWLNQRLDDNSLAPLARNAPGRTTLAANQRPAESMLGSA